MVKPILPLAFLSLISVAGCQKANDVHPTNYDVLALDTGHWEWERTVYFGPIYTPATEGYTRQLIFTDNHRALARELLLRRSNQPDQSVTYQLAVGAGGTPTITYSTQEGKLANNDVKFYRVTQQNGQQLLQLTGEKAAYDAGGYETYHWVKE